METQTQQPQHQQHPQQQHQHQPATRLVSHWAKSTPEEGIQLIFNKTDTDNAPAGVRILTSPTSIERPCQWDICLRLVSSPLSSHASPSGGSGSGPNETVSSLSSSRDHSTPPTPPRRVPSQLQQQATVPTTLYHRSATPLLVLTLQRASIRLSSAEHGGGQVGDGRGDRRGGGNMGFEDPMSPGRARCDSYRTIYIYSPRLRRDIHVQPINRDVWPQTVVFKCEDVTDEEHKYHFQIWLSGASPRQTDAETDARTTQQKNLLFAMRQDTSTCNVQICIRDPPPPMTVSQACLETASSGLFGKQAASLGSPGGHSMDGGCYSRGYSNNGSYYNAPLVTASSAPSGTTYVKHDIKHTHKPHDNNNDNNEYSTEPTRATFWAHKTILESVPFFSRMLSSGWFKEGQPDPDGIFRINLSNDMFEPKIMDTLLDYVYTREPIQDDESMGDDSNIDKIDNDNGNGDGYYNNNNTNYNNGHARYAEDYGSMTDSPTIDRRHYVSANVALNLQTVVSEPSPARPHHLQLNPYSQPPTTAGRSSSWPFTPTTTGHGRCLDTPSTLTSLPPPTPHPIHSYKSRHTNSLRTRLKPEDWFLLYRAAIHMEDLPLQAQALYKIQAQLNVQSALERALTWGPGYPEIKRVVLKYVFDERRAIFGDEERNQLRPYLWPEIEDQVDVLVEITSKIARQ